MSTTVNEKKQRESLHIIVAKSIKRQGQNPIQAESESIYELEDITRIGHYNSFGSIWDRSGYIRGNSYTKRDADRNFQRIRKYR